MDAYIVDISPTAGGEELSLAIEITDERGLRRESYCIAAQYFNELALPSCISEPYAADAELVAQIRYLSLRTEAIRAGLRLLEFAFNTKKALRSKLIRKGFPPESADEAVSFFAENGYIDEAGYAEALVQELAEKKKYGKARIKTELFGKGFESDVIRETLENAEIDFPRHCAMRIEAMGGKRIFAEPKQKQKAMAALLRYGYSYDDVRNALRLI